MSSRGRQKQAVVYKQGVPGLSPRVEIFRCENTLPAREENNYLFIYQEKA